MDQVRTFTRCDAPPVDGSGVRIAVLDTGVDPDHPDLSGRIDWNGSKCCVPGSSLEDRNGHGTHVAAIIAGTGAKSGGRFRGIAPGAELVIIKVANREGSGLGADVAAAVEHAIDLGVDIINYSGGQAGWDVGRPPWKWPTKLSARDRAFRIAAESGILCIAAAGNEGPDAGSIIRPGALPEVLCVGALGNSGAVAPTSSRGPIYLDEGLPRNRIVRADELMDEPAYWKPDIVAPGGDDLDRHQCLRRASLGLSRSPGGVVSARSRYTTDFRPLEGDEYYTCIAGTSQATAVVTALASLLLDYGRRRGLDWGPNQGNALAAILKESARSLAVGARADFGHGVLLWPHIARTLDDCRANEVRRLTVIEGPQLRVDL